MEKEFLLSFYSINKLSRQTLYSAGANLFFDKPCIGYLKKGTAKFLYQGNTFYAHEGDLIYIAFETKYHSIWYGSPDIEWYSVNFEFYSKYAFYDYRFQILKNYPSELLDHMYQSYESAPMQSAGYFYLLLNDIYQKMFTTSLPSAYSTIQPAIRYLEANYHESISVKTLASLCHMSESGFFKQFKKFLGVTPIGYKHNIMIQNAIDLLTNTKLPIEEISNRVGFPSSNYFRQIFFKLTGKTPKALRIKASDFINSSRTE